MERRSLKDEQGSLMPFWLDDESSEEEPRFKVERQPPRTLSRDAVDLVMNAIPNSTVVGKKKRTPMSEIAIRQVHDFRNRVKVALEEEPVSKKTRVIMSVEKTIERNEQLEKQIVRDRILLSGIEDAIRNERKQFLVEQKSLQEYQNAERIADQAYEETTRSQAHPLASIPENHDFGTVSFPSSDKQDDADKEIDHESEATDLQFLARAESQLREILEPKQREIMSSIELMDQLWMMEQAIDHFSKKKKQKDTTRK
eukprot:TRINITY_DN7187_c0_g1_i1.p1 TRINITY_DN7187_c0_g1~~TRINITY_DN7187_c0_g1_i1.p1  ORF type:complete len:256 (-),score=77.92 TRINITY_DN7187_c0_g1_i1:372-1139(-)